MRQIETCWNQIEPLVNWKLVVTLLKLVFKKLHLPSYSIKFYNVIKILTIKDEIKKHKQKY